MFLTLRMLPLTLLHSDYLIQHDESQSCCSYWCKQGNWTCDRYVMIPMSQAWLTHHDTVRQLALQYPKSSFSNSGSTPLLVYLTARDKSRGQDALEKLSSDPLLKKAKALKAEGGLTEIKYHPLDIADDNSIAELAAFFAKEHPDGVDMSAFKGQI
jgi:hypothetical protein